MLADRYELRGVLGEGGMARVYDGYDRVLARRVAVKLVREDVPGGREMRERMLREARAAASFQHPNAVAVYDTGHEDRTPYIVMELVEGGTLADELERSGALDQAKATRIVLDVLAALAAAHAGGLVHRDVKPANIMLPPGHPSKLADFGIAKQMEAGAGLTVDGDVMGTPQYLSPEQVGGAPATPRSDVYAVGVVLFEMLAGTPPFTGDNPFAVALAHQEDRPPRLDRLVKGLDPALVGIVHRCLEKKPERRYADAAELRAALQGRAPAPPPAAAATGPAVAPTRVAPAPPSPQPAGRRTVLVVVLVALLALAGLLAAQVLGDQVADQPGTEQEDPTPTAPAPTTPEPGADPGSEDPVSPGPQPQEPDPTPTAPSPTPTQPPPETQPPTAAPTVEPTPTEPSDVSGVPLPGPEA